MERVARSKRCRVEICTHKAAALTERERRDGDVCSEITGRRGIQTPKRYKEVFGPQADLEHPGIQRHPTDSGDQRDSDTQGFRHPSGIENTPGIPGIQTPKIPGDSDTQGFRHPSGIQTPRDSGDSDTQIPGIQRDSDTHEGFRHPRGIRTPRDSERDSDTHAIVEGRSASAAILRTSGRCSEMEQSIETADVRASIA